MRSGMMSGATPARAVERVDEQQIPGENAHAVAPENARRLRAATLGAVVDDVVVKQGRVVNELGHDGELARRVAESAEAGGAQQERERPDALAPAFEQVPSRVRRRARAAFGSAREPAFDPGEVLAEQRLKLGEATLGAFAGGLEPRGVAEHGRGVLEAAPGSFCEFLSFQILVKELWGRLGRGSTGRPGLTALTPERAKRRILMAGPTVPRAARLGRRLGIALFAALVSVPTAVWSLQIMQAVWSPSRGSGAARAANTGQLGLLHAVDRARVAAAAFAESSERAEPRALSERARARVEFPAESGRALPSRQRNDRACAKSTASAMPRSTRYGMRRPLLPGIANGRATFDARARIPMTPDTTTALPTFDALPLSRRGASRRRRARLRAPDAGPARGVRARDARQGPRRPGAHRHGQDRGVRPADRRSARRARTSPRCRRSCSARRASSRCR